MKTNMLLLLLWAVCGSYLVVASTSAINGTQIPIVVGGACAAQGHIPYQVQYSSNGKICGGSIISENYVLTAAHCVRDTEPDDVVLYIGNTHINEGDMIYIKEIKIHPNKDIALLQLTSDIEFDDNIKAIDIESEDLPKNSAVIISGWGGISDGGPISECLKFNTLKSLDAAACAKKYGPDILCLAHAEGNGACHGDSGGPAVYNGKLVGVASFVVGRCASNNADGYILVSSNYDWIQDNSL